MQNKGFWEKDLNQIKEHLNKLEASNNPIENVNSLDEGFKKITKLTLDTN